MPRIVIVERCIKDKTEVQRHFYRKGSKNIPDCKTLADVTCTRPRHRPAFYETGMGAKETIALLEPVLKGISTPHPDSTEWALDVDYTFVSNEPTAQPSGGRRWSSYTERGHGGYEE